MSAAIQYWRVGSSAEERLDLTPAEVAGHLVADWIPSLPSVSAVDLMGWPHYLLKEVGHSHSPYLAIDEQVSACERQWKGVMSWMLGVACARKVLSEEGYQWIAPVSANEAADEELQQRNVRPQGGRAIFSFPVGRERGESSTLRIILESPTLELLRAIRKFGVIDHDARYRIEISAGELSDWYAERRVLRSERVSVLREGIVVELT